MQSLYIGFTFEAKNTIQGLQNQLYAIFMYMVLFQSLSDQIMPMFLPQRDLYEVRERPSKIYRWNSTSLPYLALHHLTLRSIHLVQHHRRSSMEHPHGCRHLLHMVLPRRLCSQHYLRRPSHPRLPCLPLPLDVYALHQHFLSRGYCLYRYC